MVHAQNQLLQQKVKADLNVAREMLAVGGGVRLDAEKSTTWDAINQYTKNSSSVSLPAMMVGETPVEYQSSFKIERPVVDEVQRMVGGATTILQRMNEAGDMLHVATNVIMVDGKRVVAARRYAADRGRED